MPTPTEPETCPCGASMIDAGLGIGWHCERGLRCTRKTPWRDPPRPSWDEWGLNLAKAVATRADCRRAKHGAVILSVEHRVVATGYNGYPSGQWGCLSGGCPRGSVPPAELPHLSPYHEGIGRCDAVHAEANALLHANWADVQGGTMYITGEPCHGCLVLVKGSGLNHLVWPSGQWVKGETLEK